MNLGAGSAILIRTETPHDPTPCEYFKVFASTKLCGVNKHELWQVWWKDGGLEEPESDPLILMSNINKSNPSRAVVLWRNEFWAAVSESEKETVLTLRKMLIQ